MCMNSVSGLCLCLRDTVSRINLPVFDQQAFTETVGIAAAAITQASIAGGQRGHSNL